jgi:predicted nucleic acid-binding protein
MNVTVDTNILIYVIDDRDPAKQSVAQEVFAALARGAAPLALQVIGELQNASVRRLKQPASLAAASANQLLATFQTFGYDKAAVTRATSLFAVSRLSYWDALLVASVEAAGLDCLISEDMQDGGRHSGVEIINPFSDDGLSPRARAVLNL